MALPKLNESPKYELIIPSTQETVRFRPYLVKEEKVLMLAAESGDTKASMTAIVDTLKACIQEDISYTNLTTFDIEYAFIQIRSKSVGENSTVNAVCKECNTATSVEVPLDQILVNMPDVDKNIEITNDISVSLKWPKYLDMIAADLDDMTPTDQTFRVLVECIDEVITENERIERHNTRLAIIEEQQTDFEEQLASLTADITEVEDKLGHVEILKKAFSTNGLLAYKIENLVKDLEELTNEYLAELSDGRFSLQFVVLNDKLNVEIDDNGKTVDILALSAGELARVNTSTLLAIRKLMSSISKSRINVLFLDEVTNVLDEGGKERLVEILLREENLNTYIVSHGWTHPLLSKIDIIKEQKISRLDG